MVDVVPKVSAVSLPAADTLQARHPCLSFRAPGALAMVEVNNAKTGASHMKVPIRPSGITSQRLEQRTTGLARRVDYSFPER
jgi:hypothetical protein